MDTHFSRGQVVVVVSACFIKHFLQREEDVQEIGDLVVEWILKMHPRMLSVCMIFSCLIQRGPIYHLLSVWKCTFLPWQWLLFEVCHTWEQMQLPDCWCRGTMDRRTSHCAEVAEPTPLLASALRDWLFTPQIKSLPIQVRALGWVSTPVCCPLHYNGSK